MITDDLAQALYGMSAAEALAENKYTAIWQTGTYLKEVNGSLTIQPKEDGSHKKHAGTHYYRIVDNVTGTVICYKHEYTIKPSEVTASDDIAFGEKFTWDKVSYEVTWQGDTDSKKISRTNNSISDLMKETENAVFFEELSIEYDPSIQFASDELFLNDHKFDEDDKVKVTYTALATAYSTANGTDKIYYGSIVDALKGTTSTATVVAMQSFSSKTKTYEAGSILELAANNVDIAKTIKGDYYHKIDQNCSVASGVTLLIPFDTAMAYYDASSRTYTPALIHTTSDGNKEETDLNVLKSAYDNVDADGKPKYLKNSILVEKGKTLTNNGNIIIPGIITGGSGGTSITSATAKDHSRINLAGGASIVNAVKAANITCHGYIDELGQNTKVDMSAGNLNVVFSIVEHRGGAILLAMGGGVLAATANNYKITDCSPFNRFYVESVTSQIEVTEGATVNGFYSVYVQDDIDGNVGFFGTGSGYFVGFDSTDGKTSKAFLKYDPEKDQNELIIQGNASINKLDVKVTMDLKFFTKTVTVSTQDVYMPLSHYWNISFQKFNGTGDGATINSTGQDIKIMPGAEVKVEEGVTFKAKNIAVYTKTEPAMGNAGGFDYFAKADEDATSAFVAENAKTYVDGSLVVAGTLELTGGLGGYVQAQGDKATMKIASTSVSAKEVLMTTGTGTDGEVTYTTPPVTLTATGPIATSDNRSSTANLSNTGTYTSINGAWFKPEVTVTLDANGGVAGTTSVNLPVNKESGVTNQAELLNAVKPTRAGYTFAGWYLDQACTNAFNVASVKYDTTLYAKWTLDATVSFVTNGGTAVSPVSVAISNTGISQADLAKIKGAISSKTNHNFVAWCVDEALTTEVTAEWFAGKGSAITLYAKWEEVETYRVDLNMGELDGRTDLFNITYVEAPMGTVLALPSASNIDSTITEQRYFIGWAVTSDGDVVSNIKIDDLEATGKDGEGKDTYTLYAKWGTKVTVTFNASEYTKLITLLGTKVVGGGVESIYLKPGATYDITSFGNYQYLDDANPLLDHESYFDGTWVVSSGITVTDNVITVGADVQDGTEITLKPEWKTKHTLKIDVKLDYWRADTSASVTIGEETYSYKKQTATKTVYLNPLEAINIKIITSGYNGTIFKSTVTCSITSSISIAVKGGSTSSNYEAVSGNYIFNGGGNTTITITDS